MKRSENKRARYIDDTVGAFVLVAIVLFITTVFLAGKAQGWFEGTVEINAKFMAEGKASDEQGSFDLQEGDEIRIRSARAGRVKSIEPAEDGSLMAVIVVKSRFHRYIRVDSVARVKKIFGVAGDAYVEITEGKGAQIDDGGTILCYKDEELMAIAQRALDRLEQAVVPMVVETTGVMSNANKIAGQVSGGEGLIGAMISDPQLADEVRETISKLNELLGSASEAVDEATRLVKGAQKSWLVRKYIPEKRERIYLSPLFGIYGQTSPDLKRTCEGELKKARVSADADDVSRTAYNLAMYRCVAGDMAGAELLLREAEIAGSTDEVVGIHLAFAEIFVATSLTAGNVQGKIEAILKDRPDEMEPEDYYEFIAGLALCMIQNDKETDGAKLLSRYASAILKKGTPPAKAAYYRGSAIMESKVDSVAAGRLVDTEVRELARSGLTIGMTEAMARAGDLYVAGGNRELAALRYLVAGKSLAAQGFVDDSQTLLARAQTEAQVSGNKRLASYIASYMAENEQFGAK